MDKDVGVGVGVDVVVVVDVDMDVDVDVDSRCLEYRWLRKRCCSEVGPWETTTRCTLSALPTACSCTW